MDYYLTHRGNIEQVFRNCPLACATDRAVKYMTDQDWSPATIRRCHLLEDTNVKFDLTGIRVERID